MTTVNVPASLFDRTVLLNLSPVQTVISIVIPLLGVFPASFIPGIPFWTAIIFGAVFFLTIVIISVQTPVGQDPLEWLPAFVAYKLGSNTYLLKPTHHSRPRPVYATTRVSSSQPSQSAQSTEFSLHTLNHKKSSQPSHTHQSNSLTQKKDQQAQTDT